MIQDIMPHKFHNEYLDRIVEDSDIVFIIHKNQIWMKVENNQIQLPTYQDLKEIFKTEFSCQYLFEIDEERYYLGDIHDNVDTLIQYGYTPCINGTYRYYEPMWKVFACATAEQLARWYQSHHYCGTCGSNYVHHKEQRALVCSKCGKTIYPTISPCVIVAITDGDRILLTKYAHGAYRNYALVAGFAEIGESIEETVHREVYEETGLKVKNLRFYKSQPWGFTDTLLFGFFAELDGEDIVTLQEEELAEAIWAKREDLTDGTSLSLTNEMIQLFRNHKE